MTNCVARVGFKADPQNGCQRVVSQVHPIRTAKQSSSTCTGGVEQRMNCVVQVWRWQTHSIALEVVQPSGSCAFAPVLVRKLHVSIAQLSVGVHPNRWHCSTRIFICTRTSCSTRTRSFVSAGHMRQQYLQALPCHCVLCPRARMQLSRRRPHARTYERGRYAVLQ